MYKKKLDQIPPDLNHQTPNSVSDLDTRHWGPDQTDPFTAQSPENNTHSSTTLNYLIRANRMYDQEKRVKWAIQLPWPCISFNWKLHSKYTGVQQTAKKYNQFDLVIIDIFGRSAIKWIHVDENYIHRTNTLQKYTILPHIRDLKCKS